MQWDTSEWSDPVDYIAAVMPSGLFRIWRILLNSKIYAKKRIYPKSAKTPPSKQVVFE